MKYIVVLAAILSSCQNQPLGLSPRDVGKSQVRTLSDEKVERVRALVVYSQDADDDYPMPSPALRQKIYQRITRYYQVMSYGQHLLEFEEITDDGGFFRVQKTSEEYKRQFQQQTDYQRYRGPFALYNEDVLRQVKQKRGAQVFRDMDLIIVVGTDGGKGWYLRSVNAQGYARLGFDFSVNDTVYSADYGGITLEIGSDYTHRLYDEIEVYWTLAHEYAHWLGFRKHRPENVGIYSLMTPRLYTNVRMHEQNPGPNPLDPLLVMRFGWLPREDTTRVKRIRRETKEAKLTLQNFRSPTGLVLVQIPVPGTKNPSAEENYENFYLVYYRNDASEFDRCYPGSGLLIWHTVHEDFLDIECALAQPGEVNKDHLDIGEDMGGLRTDFFDGRQGREFTPYSNPNSNIWGIYNPSLADQPSGISVKDIEEVGSSIRFRIILE